MSRGSSSWVWECSDEAFILRRLDSEQDAELLQHLLEGDSEYAQNILGVPFGPAEGQSTLLSRPPDSEPADKFALGLTTKGEESTFVGFVDMILRYPSATDCFLGLIFVTPERRRQGLGTHLVDAAAGIAAATQDRVRRMSTSYVETMGRGPERFLEACGFNATGTREPYANGTVASVRLGYERVIDEG